MFDPPVSNSKLYTGGIRTSGDRTIVYDRNHLFGLGSDTETETENWPKLSADTETNRNQKILNWKALYQGVCKKLSCQLPKHFLSTYITNKFHVNQL